MQHGAEDEGGHFVEWRGVCDVEPLHYVAGGGALEVNRVEVEPNEDDDGGDGDGFGQTALQVIRVTVTLSH